MPEKEDYVMLSEVHVTHGIPWRVLTTLTRTGELPVFVDTYDARRRLVRRVDIERLAAARLHRADGGSLTDAQAA